MAHTSLLCLARSVFAIGLACLVLAGCATHRKPPTPPRPVPSAAPPRPPAPLSELKRNILDLARREWDYFGRQTVVFDGEEESIPHVGKWEDDPGAYAFRVNDYWRAVGRPELTGNHCSEPWSAAFVSWVMREAGVPDYQFEPAEAHWIYLARIMAEAGSSYAGFVPRTIDRYTPQPGDLICTSRGGRPPPVFPGGYLDPQLVQHLPLHCDIVVEREGDTLAAIGGNVRNSVSKTIVKLDKQGLMQPTQRRPWFMALENRL